MNGQESLLVVDDNEMNREMLSRRLIRKGYRVELAENGIMALDMVDRGHFDLILLDIMMPDMNGIQILTKLRTQYTATSLPVIMVTAKEQSEDIVEALESGANDYVTKPIDFAVTLARIRTQLSLKRAAEEIARRDEALVRDMAMARTIHRALLPPCLPTLKGFEFGLKFVPSGDIGGDFYNFIPLKNEQQLGILFADITGHGVPAALLATMFKALSDEVVESDASPAACISDLNGRLVKAFPEGNFASAFYAVLDAGARTMTFAKASQEPALLFRPGCEVQILEHGGPALGLLRPEELGKDCYTDQSVQLLIGDTLFFYTDGLLEVENAEGQMLERDVLIHWMSDAVALPPQAMVEQVYSRVTEYTGTSEFPDDVAALAIRVVAG